MKLFILTNEQARQQAIEHIRSVPLDGKTEVKVGKHRGGRSLAQNRLYHMWIKIISDETGYTTKELHDELRAKFLGWDMIKAKFENDNAYMVMKSTTELKVDEFSEYLNNIDRFMATEVGITLPHPEDMYYEALGYKRNAP